MTTDGTLDRRRFLRGSGATLSLVGLSGCLGILGGDEIQLPTPALGAPKEEGTPRVLVYEDYACPHCRDFEENTFPSIYENYIQTEEITYEHHDFPIPVSNMSLPTASAARSVQHRSGAQEFWQFKQAVFRNQDQLGWDLIREIANNLNLDGNAVVEDARNNRFRGVVEGDKQTGESKGVRGTPGVIVDGTLLEEPTYQRISDEIENAL